MTDDRTTYHVLRAEDGEVLALVRLRETEDALHPEAYRPGQGWVADHRATDVFVNGQDYDLVDVAEAERLAAAMEDGRA